MIRLDFDGFDVVCEDGRWDVGGTPEDGFRNRQRQMVKNLRATHGTWVGPGLDYEAYGEVAMAEDAAEMWGGTVAQVDVTGDTPEPGPDGAPVLF